MNITKNNHRYYYKFNSFANFDLKVTEVKVSSKAFSSTYNKN